LVQGQIGVDAGCGSGSSAISLALQYPGIKFIGIDLSRGIIETKHHPASTSNVCFIQGNLMSPPLAKLSFDFVYSFGVLHHTRDPFHAFLELVKLLRPGGRITVFVYKDFSDLRLKKFLLWPVSQIRRITTKLPPFFLKLLAWFFAPFVFLLLTLPARLFRQIGMDRLAQHIPYGIFPHITGIASSLEDRFGAPYEFRFSIRDLEKWALSVGLVNTHIVDCLPWGFSGLVLSGITANNDPAQPDV